jgi:RNA polymerase sigma-70 factor (ECF subfamily)
VGLGSPICRGIMAAAWCCRWRPEHAPLAQSAERLHGKEEVESSILSGSSPVRLVDMARRRSSVGESARLIIERSTVRICPSLQERRVVEADEGVEVTGRTRRLKAVAETGCNPSLPAGSEERNPDLSVFVERAVAGDRDAFDQLVRLTQRDAYGLAFRLTGNEEDARDVVQDSYLRAYRAIGSFRGDSQFGTWLYRIVANCSSTYLSKRSKRRHEPLGLGIEPIEERPEFDPAVRVEVDDLRSALDRAVAELPPRLRAVVVLRDVYEVPHEAIAEELGISLSAAKVRLHRARRRLRQQVFPMPGGER